MKLWAKRKFWNDKRAIVASSAVAAGKLLRSDQKDTPIYAKQVHGSRITDTEVDSVIAGMNARKGDVGKLLQEENERLQIDVLEGRIDAPEAEVRMTKATQNVIRNERKSLEANSDVVNDAMGQYNNGEISAQQLNKIFKAGGQQVSGIEAFQEIEKEHLKEEEALAGIRERIQKEGPEPPKEFKDPAMMSAFEHGEDFVREFEKWKQAPDSYRGEIGPDGLISFTADGEAPKNQEERMTPEVAARIAEFEKWDDERAEFEDSLRSDLAEKGIMGDRANQLIRGVALEGFQSRMRGAGEAGRDIYQDGKWQTDDTVLGWSLRRQRGFPDRDDRIKNR